jgi:hypothetical protein
MRNRVYEDIMDGMDAIKSGSVQKVIEDAKSDWISPTDYDFAFSFALCYPRSDKAFDVESIAERIDSVFSSIRTISDTSDVCYRCTTDDVSDDGRIPLFDNSKEYDFSVNVPAIVFVVGYNGYIANPKVIIRLINMLYHISRDFNYFDVRMYHYSNNPAYYVANFSMDDHLGSLQINRGRILRPGKEDGFGTVSKNMEDVYRDVVSFCQIVIHSGYKGLSNQDIEDWVKDIYEKAADRKLFLKGL